MFNPPLRGSPLQDPISVTAGFSAAGGGNYNYDYQGICSPQPPGCQLFYQIQSGGIGTGTIASYAGSQTITVVATGASITVRWWLQDVSTGQLSTHYIDTSGTAP